MTISHTVPSAFLPRLTKEPYALVFAGQSSPWRSVWEDLAADTTITIPAMRMIAGSDEVLSAVRMDLMTLGVADLPFSPQGVEATAVGLADWSPELSVPGILLCQYATLLALAADGLDTRRNRPVSMAGHSQGVLAVHLHDAWTSRAPEALARIFAIARLIGAAAGRQSRDLGLHRRDAATPMVAVRGLSRTELHGLVSEITDPDHPVSIGVRNDHAIHVLSGSPRDLRRVTDAANSDVACEFLDVGAPFHSELMEDAVSQVAVWADACGLDVAHAEKIAREVLTDHIDWPTEVDGIAAGEAAWVLDCGPGTTIARLTRDLLEGTGLAVAMAGNVTERERLAIPGAQSPAAQDWSHHAPRLVRLPDGDTVLDTAFSRLTGRSPVLLAGMTPTTVDPEIVSAAANAGFWAELAGGGQVTEDVYAGNLDLLREQLAPGVTATFNSMYLDRYLWNLQFGSQRIVSRSRLSGAPLDGVVISAGVPELDESIDLISRLRAEGFPYVTFKPGTVQQILRTVEIARAVPDVSVIVQVEDGHSGGHHSWEDLDHLLLQTYATLRSTPNLVLCVGGGIGTPERAADYLSGQWSERHGRRAMPVDGVLVGTAAMTVKEARTTREVKQVLLATDGVDPQESGGAWITPGTVRGGMTSGLSHLRADMHEVDNSAAAAARLIAEIGNDAAAVLARKDEVAAALAKTCRPWFGDLESMTYAQWVRRFAELCHPWVDPTWTNRFHDLLQRVEARLSPLDHGEIATMFPTVACAQDAHAAADRVVEEYPLAETTLVTPIDAAWFPTLCRSHPKPMPFVPVLDEDLLTWWGQDGLWQAQDDRYPADAVRIIPGPVSVAGIDRVDEPVAELLGRFEDAAVARLEAGGTQAVSAHSRLGELEPSRSMDEFIRSVPHIMWTGHLIANPAARLPHSRIDLLDRPTIDGVASADMVITLDTAWDEDAAGADKHAVRQLVLPLLLPSSTSRGGVPVIDENRLPEQMRALLTATAGVVSTTVNGDVLSALPTMEPTELSKFGQARHVFTLAPNLGPSHAGVTASALPPDLVPDSWVPDALLGPAWPAIYAALGSAMHDGLVVIEGLLNAVHLDHVITFDESPQALIDRGIAELEVVAHVESVEESASGRIVTVCLQYLAGGGEIGSARERFAIQGRATGSAAPSDPPRAGGGGSQVRNTPRSTLRRTTVHAPGDMTPFAIVSGDFNPIHTSQTAAVVAGLTGPLVHGMWLSATAQHIVSAAVGDGRHSSIAGWTYRMFGPVDLNAEIEVIFERTGLVTGGGLALEITCRSAGTVVSRATATTRAPRTAYVYPGQGIQTPGMGLDERAACPAADDVWRRADAHTRAELGFSILAIVRDNPTEITARGVTYRHPEGVLHLTQFTQVALATLAFAQTERMRSEGVLVSGAAFAGHSLGEYNALAAYARVFPVETVIELVFHRGSTMHALVERDEQGRSNYRMGVLRPDQLGLTDADITDYVSGIVDESGEFIEIVNFNLAGRQYAVAGTRRGLDVLAVDAERRAAAAGGRRPFMLVPGIDVPFHSAVLRNGVAEFRQKLEERIPHDLDLAILTGSYVPNLVARPFEVSRDFAQSILDVVPSEAIGALLATGEAWDEALTDEPALARLLLIELLSWQFASPVRWIETQEVLFSSSTAGGLDVAEAIEIGLASSPTLTNLAERTLATPAFSGRSVTVLNLQRDLERVLHTDVQVIDSAEEDDDEPEVSTAQPAAATGSQPVPVTPSAVAAEAVADLPFTAASALRVLVAHSARIRLDQIRDDDTTETLTNGVSSRRNQLLMDLSAELGVISIDGAAESDIVTLSSTVNRLVHNYRAFGPVLAEAIRDRLRKLLGAANVKPSRISDRVTSAWGLGEGWVAHVTAELLLGSREGTSTREGDLSTLPTDTTTTAQEVDGLVDAAVRSLADRQGITVALVTSDANHAGQTVDSAVLDAFAAKVTGPVGVLATTARQLLDTLGLGARHALPAESSDDHDVVAAVSAELGSGWADLVTPTFDAERAVLLDDRWASVREDLARLWIDGTLPDSVNFTAAGPAVSAQASWWAERAETDGRRDLATRFRQIAEVAARPVDDTNIGAHRDDVAVVTGATPDSIAGGVVRRLLAEGATVIATTSRLDAGRLNFAKELYRHHAAPGARLWLVQANLSSYRDVDALVDWVGSVWTRSVGGTPVVEKPALLPTLLFPFAAPRVHGTLAEAGPVAENQMRLLLWSVERMIAGLAAVGRDTVVDHRLHVVLPGSPNRGMFGGDGAYAEAKTSFDAIVSRWHVEADWADRVSIAHPRIGWVRGTGLMGGNDPLVRAVEAAGVRTWSTDEMAARLLQLCTTSARQHAARTPLDADLTGGLSTDLDFATVRNSASPAKITAPAKKIDVTDVMVAALPSPTRTEVPHPDPAQWGEVTAGLEDTIVIVGYGEVGPWGSSRTRWEAELGISPDSTVELTSAGVLELAWMTGLVTWRDSPVGGWYNAAGDLVPEAEIFDRFHDEVVARSGVRFFVEDGPLQEGHSPESAAIHLDRDVTFSVRDEAEARSYLEADPRFTRIGVADDGEWAVTRTVGAQVRVPRRATMSRRIGGQFPTGFDPARWGIPASMIDSIDRIAVWNLVTAVDAFISSGFTPAELLSVVHPAEVASTQGTGFGGMSSMRRLFVDRYLGEDFPQDILQETLPNVVAAHTMQSWVGGYGAMINPVGACATAAVSLDEAVDKILRDKADFVVAGAIDDIQVESIEGFGAMNATADTQSMLDRGIGERFLSRANDRRRGGFVESQGGGTVLVTRASIAVDMGLPVFGVVAYVRTFADGAHTSIPAPGIGALAAGRNGTESVLARNLRALGVTVDDVSVLSKHDTSTLANDPNEADLHTRLSRALGRTEGNPLFVVSQKSVVGHTKGGAAALQIGGLTQILRTGLLPANAALDCVDEKMASHPDLVWLRRPLDVGSRGLVKAGVLTSLGFGHVSALVALVHPAAFEAIVAAGGDTPAEGMAALGRWRERSDARLRAGARHREAGMLGRAELFTPVQSRRLPDNLDGTDPHETEAAMLLEPTARLGSEGRYAAVTTDEAPRR